MCVNTFKHKYIRIQRVDGNSIFYLKHHWGRGKTTLGFGQDRIGTLVSMATDSSHRIIMGKSCLHSSAFNFDRIFFVLAGNEDNHNISDEFDQIRPRTAELAALERLKKLPLTYNGRNVVSTLAPSFLIGFSSFLQVTRTAIKLV